MRDHCGLCPGSGFADVVGTPADLGTWAAGVLRGYEVPGWFAVFPRRHVESADGLSDPEADGLGGALRQVTAGIRAETGCAKVYAVSFGERLPHWHVLLMAVPAELPAELRGVALVGAAAQLRDPDAAAPVTARVRSHLAR